MKKIVYVCDRCQKQITGRLFTLYTAFSIPEEGDTEEQREKGPDLCASCFEVVDDAIMTAIKKPSVEATPMKKPGRKPLDTGKMRALRAAGWTYEKIADELGCSTQTVINYLKKEEEDGREEADI